MDLGIAGRTAVVCGVATDLGLACARALAEEGVEVLAVDVSTDNEQLSELPGRAIACDLREEAERNRLLEICPQPDILVNHAPGPPMGDFRQWGDSDWQAALQTNMLTAIDMIKRVLDGMISRDFGRIVNITSQSVRAPMVNLDLSNAARAGLTGFVAGVAREHRQADVTINNVLPGLFDTAPLRRHIDKLTSDGSASRADIVARFADKVPLSRIGRLEEFAAVCTFLCGKNAGYINGQNILVDGGTFPGVV